MIDRWKVEQGKNIQQLVNRSVHVRDRGNGRQLASTSFCGFEGFWTEQTTLDFFHSFVHKFSFSALVHSCGRSGLLPLLHSELISNCLDRVQSRKPWTWKVWAPAEEDWINDSELIWTEEKVNNASWWGWPDVIKMEIKLSSLHYAHLGQRIK